MSEWTTYAYTYRRETNVDGRAVRITSAGDLAAAVRGRRIDLQLSQAELATRAGVSRPWLGGMKVGKPTAGCGLILRVLDTPGRSFDLVVAEPGPQEPGVDLDALLAHHEGR